MHHKSLTLTSLSISLLLSAFTASAQDSDTASQYAFTKGSQSISIGVGLNAGQRGPANLLFSDNLVSLPTFMAIYDYGLVDIGRGTISIGGLASFRTGYSDHKNTTIGDFRASSSTYTLGTRITYHYHTRNARFDPYAGTFIGLQVQHSNTSYCSSRAHGYLLPSIFIGAKYYFTKKSGMFLELAPDRPQLRIGASFKF